MAGHGHAVCGGRKIYIGSKAGQETAIPSNLF